jgi:hypothetical protein
LPHTTATEEGYTEKKDIKARGDHMKSRILSYLNIIIENHPLRIEEFGERTPYGLVLLPLLLSWSHH